MNWNKRYRDNMERMKSGDIYEVAEVVRNLTFKQKEKGPGQSSDCKKDQGI